MGIEKLKGVNWESQGVLKKEKTKEYCLPINPFSHQIITGQGKRNFVYVSKPRTLQIQRDRGR